MGLVPLHDFYGKEIVDEKNWSILEPYLKSKKIFGSLQVFE